MRFAATGLSLSVVLGLAACANNPNRPTDTGNMASPTPLQSGVYGTSQPRAGADTGSMGIPSQPAQSGLRAQPDTLGNMGSMQIPQTSEGNLRSRTTRP